MMDVTRFLREGAKFMANDRPDLWSVQDAFDNISAMFAYLAGLDESGVVTIGGFALQKFLSEEDGTVEYQLQRQILSFDVDLDEYDTNLRDFTESSHLMNIELDIPNPYDPPIDTDD